jgi:hypothetical protein
MGEKKPHKPMTKKKKVLLVCLSVFLALIVSTAAQFGYNMLFVKTRSDIALTKGDDNEMNALLKAAPSMADSDFSDASAISSRIAGAIERIDDRNDCADFTASALIRLYLENKSRLQESNKEEIKKTLLGFKYWPKAYDGQDDSMCFWSENHQIMFAVTEYLVSQEWPDGIFADRKNGAYHLEQAKGRINAWMQLRFTYGFSEYYSNNYYPENIGPMSNFIQFASSADAEMVSHMKMIMDIIFYDIASQSYKYIDANLKVRYAFMSASGRMYMDNKSSDDTGNRLRNYVNEVLNINADETTASGSNFFVCFKHMYETVSGGNALYQVPSAIKNIFAAPEEARAVKSSSGLDVNELGKENLIGQDDKQIMAQLGMEAFTNPDVIANSISFMNKYHLYRNEFLNDFKMIRLWPLELTHSLGALSASLHPSTDGKAIQRGNIYTYRAPGYSMSTNQAYQPGEYGDQQQISLTTLASDLSVYTVQPMRVSTRENYWVGQGRMPYAVQEKNINLSVYHIPDKKGALEPHIVKFTHTYFPVGLFDEVNLDHLGEGYIFGRKGTSYLMVAAKADETAALKFKNDMDGVTAEALTTDRSKIKASVKSLIEASGDLRYDLIFQGGKKHAYVTEVSSILEDGSFSSFVTRMINNPFSYDASSDTLTYKDRDVEHKAIYDKSFTVGGDTRDLEYSRYESDFVKGGNMPRKASVLEFSYLGASLSLDYAQNKREIS